MKLRGRSILEEVNDSMPKRAKCRDPDNFEEIYPDAITAYGKYGKCHGSECDGVPAETTEIEGKRLCRACASKNHDDRRIESKKFDKSDAEFKCPAFSKAESCKSEKISFEEFYLGSCCEEASKWLTTNEKAKKTKLLVIKKLYAEAKQEQRKAKLESEEKKNKIKNMLNLQSERKIRTKEIFKTILETDKEIEATKKGKEDTEEKLREAEEDFDIVAKRFKRVVSVCPSRRLPKSPSAQVAVCPTWADGDLRQTAM